MLDGDRLLVKVSVGADDRTASPWVGILTVLTPDSDAEGRKYLQHPVVEGAAALPRYYLDTSVSPSVIWLAAALMTVFGAYGAHLLLTLRPGGEDMVAKALLRYALGGNGATASLVSHASIVSPSRPPVPFVFLSTLAH